MTTLELVPAILTSDLPVPTAFAQKLCNLTPAAQLDFILDIFAQTQKADKTICHIIDTWTSSPGSPGLDKETWQGDVAMQD